MGWRGTGTPLAQMTARPTMQTTLVSGFSTLQSGGQSMDDAHDMAAIVLRGVVFLAATSLNRVPINRCESMLYRYSAGLANRG